MPNLYQNVRDTAANWASNNPILPQGLFGYETDTLKWKLGDGVTAWNSLGYSSSLQNSSVVSEINAALTDDDELLVYDDSANEPKLRKSLLSRIWTYLTGKLSANTSRLDLGGTLRASGILFGTDTADANTLDDYEEGTWTPTDGSGASLTFTEVRASYTKIGREVTCYASLKYPVTANTNATAIAGLPFAAAGSGAADEGFGGAIALTTYDANFTIYIGGGASSVKLYNRSAASITNANISNKYLEFFVRYRV